MKNNKLNKSFGVLVLVSLFVGGISLLGYVFAFFVGVPQAEILCEFIQKTFYPYMIQFTSIGVGLGLLAMYLSGDKSLSISKKKRG